MNRLLAFGFGFFIISIIVAIISLIPTDMTSNGILKKAKDNNITFNSRNVWRLVASKMQITTNDFSFEINKATDNGKDSNNKGIIIPYKLYGRGEEIIISLIRKKIIINNAIISVYLDKQNINKNIFEIIKEIQNKIPDKSYSVQVKNVAIQILIPDGDKYKIDNEFYIKNLSYDKSLLNQNIAIGLNINNNKMLYITGKAENELNSRSYKSAFLKLQAENIDCKLYIQNTDGYCSCNIADVKRLIEDIGYKQDTSSLDFLNNKFLSFKFDMLIADKISAIGKIKFNNSLGDFSYVSGSNNINIKFNTIDFDDDNIMPAKMKNNSNENEGSFISENPWLNTIWKDSLEKSMPIGQNMLYRLLYELKNAQFNIRVKIDNIKYNNVQFQDLWIQLAKQSTSHNIALVDMNLRTNSDEIIIKQDTNNQYSSNIIATGTSLNNLIQLTSNRYINKNLSNNTYTASGTISLGFDQNIINCNIALPSINSKGNIGIAYTRDDQGTTRNYIINNLPLEYLLNLDRYYQDYKDQVLNSLNQNKQSSVLENIFQYTRSLNNDSALNVSCYNCKLFNETINAFSVKYKSNEKKIRLDLLLDSSFITNGVGIINYETSTENEDVPNFVTLKLNIDYTDISKIKNLHTAIIASDDIFSALYKDKEYSVPSFIGLNGLGDVNIAKININNNILRNFRLSIKLQDGVLYKTFSTTFNANGQLACNSNLYLQSIPKLDLSFNITGFELRDLLQNSNISGNLSANGSLFTQGFNPVNAIKLLTLNGETQIFNLAIAKFNLLELSKKMIQRNKITESILNNIVQSGSLYFPSAIGKMQLTNQILNGSLEMKRELVGGTMIYKYDTTNNAILNMQSTFGIINNVNADNKKSTLLYLPIACNGAINNPKCIIGWDKLLVD